MSVVPSGAANPDSGLLFQNPVILKLLSPGSFSSGKRRSNRLQLTWLSEEEVAFRMNLESVKNPCHGRDQTLKYAHQVSLVWPRCTVLLALPGVVLSNVTGRIMDSSG